MLGLFIYLREVFPNWGVKIVINVMLVKSWVSNLSNCKETIEENVKELSKVSDSWKRILNISKKHNKSNNYIFPTIEDEEVRKTIIEESSMMEDKSIQKFEFSKAKVTNCSCWISFFANNTNSYVSLLNHTNIISSISDCQDNSLHILLYKLDNLCFLSWRTSAKYNWSCL